MAERYFDRTHFGTAENFKKLLTMYKLSTYKRSPHFYAFRWSNPDVFISTSNNPLTGEYKHPNEREKEKGYASYIRVFGDAALVMSISRDIKRMAKWIKGEKGML
jgi:hypothetical protein